MTTMPTNPFLSLHLVCQQRRPVGRSLHPAWAYRHCPCTLARPLTTPLTESPQITDKQGTILETQKGFSYRLTSLLVGVCGL